MDLAKKEKKIQLLQSKIKDCNKLFKNKLLKMKKGPMYDKWKSKYTACLQEKKEALEHMKRIMDYLDENLEIERVQFERENIKKQIEELHNELEEMKISK